MTKTYYIIKDNERVRTLISIIKSHYKSKIRSPIQVVNLEHVCNKIEDTNIRYLIKNSWKDLEMVFGHELRLLINKKPKGLIHKIYKKSHSLYFISKDSKDLKDSTYYNKKKLEL